MFQPNDCAQVVNELHQNANCLIKSKFDSKIQFGSVLTKEFEQFSQNGYPKH